MTEQPVDAQRLDPVMYGIMAQYGAAMLQVQMFESSLATLVAITGLKARRSKSWEDSLRRGFRRTWHLFQKASASELRKLLPSDLDANLADEIQAAVAWRDFLAHRYLRARLFVLRDGVVSLRPEGHLVVELFEIGQAFASLTARVNSAVAQAQGRLPLPDTPPPKPVADAIAELGWSAMTTAPPRFGTAGDDAH